LGLLSSGGVPNPKPRLNLHFCELYHDLTTAVGLGYGRRYQLQRPSSAVVNTSKPLASLSATTPHTTLPTHPPPPINPVVVRTPPSLASLNSTRVICSLASPSTPRADCLVTHTQDARAMVGVMAERRRPRAPMQHPSSPSRDATEGSQRPASAASAASAVRPRSTRGPRAVGPVVAQLHRPLSASQLHRPLSAAASATSRVRSQRPTTSAAHEPHEAASATSRVRSHGSPSPTREGESDRDHYVHAAPHYDLTLLRHCEREAAKYPMDKILSKERKLLRRYALPQQGGGALAGTSTQYVPTRCSFTGQRAELRMYRAAGEGGETRFEPLSISN
jgi:hypothetical protein